MIFAFFDVLLAVNMCINYSFFAFIIIIIIIITNDNVYGAVIMTQSLREFTRFILTNADQRQCQVAADPQTRPTDLGYESACRL